MALTYDPIASSTISGTSTSNVTFSSIPATYTDLVLIVSGAITVTGDSSVVLQFNGDTTTNYSTTLIDGNGSTASSTRASNINYCYVGSISQSISTTIAHIMNYANTTTYKTVLGRGNTTDYRVRAYVSLWRKTPEAINSIKVYSNGSENFTSGSIITLYGIKASA